VTSAAIDALTAAIVEDRILTVLWIALLAVKAFALTDALFRSDAMFVAADKQNKAFWLVILSVFLVLHILFATPIGLLNLIGSVAALVYIVDVRPTLRAMRHY
jgi:Protein of unknown function (DUF2516)